MTQRQVFLSKMSAKQRPSKGHSKVKRGNFCEGIYLLGESVAGKANHIQSFTRNISFDSFQS